MGVVPLFFSFPIESRLRPGLAQKGMLAGHLHFSNLLIMLRYSKTAWHS